MVESSGGRTLSHAENASLFAWALVNAICEEVVSRGFFLHEFKRRGGVTFWQANALQATSFGIWHFHGIPSGWTGVGLTFVYGLVMGFLLEYGGGLLLPIVAHTIADYFIFAVIARQGKFM
ncbi:CAAX protease self-immunity [Fragilaria crotonensis]|nr:CAAX protease self-immunity [Fragilaria crotonensis]